eukprot:10159329-Lingulodinium_polyedra.AAC.1
MRRPRGSRIARESEICAPPGPCNPDGPGGGSIARESATSCSPGGPRGSSIARKSQICTPPGRLATPAARPDAPKMGP